MWTQIGFRSLGNGIGSIQKIIPIHDMILRAAIITLLNTQV